MNRPRNGVARQRTVRPSVEALEDRLVLSWAAVPPYSIPLPTATTAVTLNRQGDAAGQGAINSQIDFYRLIAPVNGTYRFSTATPTGSL